MLDEPTEPQECESCDFVARPEKGGRLGRCLVQVMPSRCALCAFARDTSSVAPGSKRSIAAFALNVSARFRVPFYGQNPNRRSADVAENCQEHPKPANVDFGCSIQGASSPGIGHVW